MLWYSVRLSSNNGAVKCELCKRKCKRKSGSACYQFFSYMQSGPTVGFNWNVCVEHIIKQTLIILEVSKRVPQCVQVILRMGCDIDLWMTFCCVLLHICRFIFVFIWHFKTEVLMFSFIKYVVASCTSLSKSGYCCMSYVFFNVHVSVHRNKFIGNKIN